MIRKGLLTCSWNTRRFTSSQKIVMVRSLFTVLLVQGLFLLHIPTVLALPNPDSSFSSSSSSSPSPTPTPTPTPTVHTIAFYMPSPFPETIFSMLYTQTNIGTVSPISTDRSAGPDYTMYVEERVVNVPFRDKASTRSRGHSNIQWRLLALWNTSDDSLIYFHKDCELTGSNDIIQLSPSSSDEIGLSCDRRELGDCGWKGNQFLDPLAVYTLTVTQDPQSILPRFSDVVKESSMTSENSMTAEATRTSSNGSIGSFGDTGANTRSNYVRAALLMDLLWALLIIFSELEV
ncbi:hypothetical protein K435DRAFT_866599 [Dendrothele bispora CBS 962.96]|uniref:Uncharacterized protein n=1 Tax=Dendrothele bispora (strain CBS 962.96) TaxID=1314807 RepID=A0A4S8LGD7_DENBC|nr:hypothetical protein K435DRAFT_866599 [Dendrothele bispora CBS 962.96]